MPFTLSHPAAVLPIARRWPNAFVLSALVAGSLAPDLAYFAPVTVPRVESHSLPGLFGYCLPASAALFVAFHLVFKRPLATLLPDSLARRVARWTAGGLPDRPAASIVASLLLGAVTHLLWDSFTHETSALVRHWPVFQTTVFTLSGMPVSVARLLQHGSSLLGLLVIAASARSALSRPAPAADPPAPASVRAFVLAALVAVPAAVAWNALGTPLGELARPDAWVPSAFVIVVYGLRTASVLLAAYGLAWHTARALRRLPRTALAD